MVPMICDRDNRIFSAHRIFNGPVRHLSLEPLAFDGVWSLALETIDNSSENISLLLQFF